MTPWERAFIIALRIYLIAAVLAIGFLILWGLIALSAEPVKTWDSACTDAGGTPLHAFELCVQNNAIIYP